MTDQSTDNTAARTTMPEDTLVTEPGVCGPRSEYIILKSKDGHEFYIARKNIISCKMIEGMLSGPGEAAPDEPNEVIFDKRDFMTSAIVQKLCHYFIYRLRYCRQYKPLPPPFPLSKEEVLPLFEFAFLLSV